MIHNEIISYQFSSLKNPQVTHYQTCSTKHALRIEMGYKKTGVTASFLALLDNVLHFSYVEGAT